MVSDDDDKYHWGRAFVNIEADIVDIVWQREQLTVGQVATCTVDLTKQT